MMRRQAGILLHPTSLPGPFGIGNLGPELDRFLDWTASAGQSLWQVLPLGPTGFGDSPYVAASAFAGNPVLVSPERLIEEGFLEPSALDDVPRAPEGRAAFDAARAWSENLLRRAWERVRSSGPSSLRDACHAFAEAPEQKDWLAGWALFAALKRRHSGSPWIEWDGPLRRREPDALLAASRDLADEMEYQVFAQFLFFRQWDRARRGAHARGIRIFGDMPFYMALDSADVWEHADCFQLDEEHRPTAMSGVPPDYFSDSGQLWGTPLYDWRRLEADGFAWWVRRVRAELRKVDLLRLDHFRAFQAYWSIPAGAEDARSGHWEPGPEIRFFRSLQGALGGDLPIVAEDLGEITDDVRALRDVLGIPGMRVLQFGLGHPESEHHPSRIPERCAVYTGTHDNDTARGWYESLDPAERERVIADLRELGAQGLNEGEIHWGVIEAAYRTAAEIVVVPAQDVRGLGSEARMNTPSEPEGNWTWRLRPGALDAEAAARLSVLAMPLARRTGA